MVADSGLDALADAVGDALSDAAADVANPVPDADAAPASQVVNVPCDIQIGGLVFAEAMFAGKLANELATVHAISNYGAPVSPESLGYSKRANAVLFYADGKVAAQCGSDAVHADSVDFILP